MRETIYKKWILILRILLGILLLFTFINFWYVNRQDNYDKQYISYAAELRVLIERFARHAGEAVLKAKENAFTYLKYRRNEFSGILEILKRGKQDSGGTVTLPPSPKIIQDKELASLSRIWTIEKANADIILNNQELVLSLHDIVNTIITLTSKIQVSYLDIIGLLENRKSTTGRDYAEIATQIFDAQEVEESVRKILDMEQGGPTDLERRFTKKIANFEGKIKELKLKYANDAVYGKLLDIEKAFVIIKERTQDILNISQNLVKVNAAYQAIYGMIPTFLEDTAALERAYTQLSSTRLVNNRTALALSLLTLLTLLTLLWLGFKDNQATLRASEDENRALQAEVQQLVTELQDLANGNLTVKASTNVGVTKAIAEAVNYALNALRQLVRSINQTSQKVSSSANEVKKITTNLAKAVTNQSEEIESTTSSVSSMAASIDQVSLNAKKSALVAENSVQIAHDGAMVVQNTIGGMERIRDQIKETEKRIRRLGESSQEIGDIVSLIDGISEQTNILSLNAAIQAAMAGEAGMGFAVVADEVQQLAVKSSQAAKEVENIVKAIRGDTSRATESMERAISEVTSGTKLAHDAGLALGKIESVSKNLSELIQGISMAAEEQARVSSKITRMMEIIESIAKDTASGTANTSESIDNLAYLVHELHSSVAEFKLPDESYGQ